MFRRLFRKLFLKKKKSRREIPRQNSFQEAMYSIYLSNYIKETDPERYNRMVEEAEEEEKQEEEGWQTHQGEIRLSERRFYQKITDIYATAMDYNKNASITKEFFVKVQNKLHYAIHGNIAAEVIYKRADASKEHMGLNTWEKSSHEKIVKRCFCYKELFIRKRS